MVLLCNEHTLGLPEDPLVYIIIAISSGAGGQAIDVTGPTIYTLYINVGDK